MAGIPKVKITFDADFDDLKKGIKGGQDEIQGFAGHVEEFGKKAAAAFAVAAAAAAAYAVKLAVDGVKAAIEDEAAQVRLATALKNATGATDAMIKSVEAQILKQSLATGVADEQLRPALSRLALSTNDVTKAQDLLTLALDISQATGKGLDAVANALGKAYDGNTAALGKLGVGLSSAELKAMTFTEVQTKLSDLFGGAAAANAETFQGRMARLKVAFDESVETIGFALLPILQKLLDVITTYILPIVEKFSDAISNKKEGGLGSTINDVVDTIKSYAIPIFDSMVTAFKKIKSAIEDNIDNFKSFFEVVKYIAPIVGKLIGGAVTVIGNIAEVVIDIIGKVLAAIKPMLNFAIDSINLIIKGINLIKPGTDIAPIPKIGSSSGFATSGAPGAISSGGSSGATGATGATVVAAAVAAAASGAAMVGLTGGTVGGGAFTDSQNAARLAAAAQAAGGGFTDSQNAARISITVNGAIDPESTARQVVNLMNDSLYRGGGGGGNSLVMA